MDSEEVTPSLTILQENAANLEIGSVVGGPEVLGRMYEERLFWQSLEH